MVPQFSAATRSDSMSRSVARDETPSWATKAPDGANAANMVESPILAAPRLRSHLASLLGLGTQILDGRTALQPLRGGLGQAVATAFDDRKGLDVRHAFESIGRERRHGPLASPLELESYFINEERREQLLDGVRL